MVGGIGGPGGLTLAAAVLAPAAAAQPLPAPTAPHTGLSPRRSETGLSQVPQPVLGALAVPLAEPSH